MPDIRILVFAGSARQAALSRRLAAVAAKEIALFDTEVTQINLVDYPLPAFDADGDDNPDIPENAQKLAKLIASHHGIFIATNEFNQAVPSLLKSAIDWVSRVPAKAGSGYRGKICAVGGVAEGPVGGARALGDLRRILPHAWQAMVVPEQVVVPFAQNGFDEAGRLIDPKHTAALRVVCERLVDIVRRMEGR